ncbi:MAG: hypothetical protein IMZ69_07185 [Spirochaetes bacterium]|nr:hypothetical protein [Spirochaetota bacterium]
MNHDDILAIILDVISNANLARDPVEQLEVSPTARVFGRGSSLDSLGLVGLLIDIEEGLHAVGVNVTLSDDRAMSQTKSPFRSVPALVEYISTLLAEKACPRPVAS